MNIKLLEQVRDYIRDHPEEYDQRSWCGSACCVAGIAFKLTGKDVKEKGILSTAASVLDLDDDQAIRLFSGLWDNIRKGRYYFSYENTTPEERSRIAVDRINFFIATKGTDDERRTS